MEDGEVGERPGEEALDLRLVEGGREARVETAVAGVTGAESWLLKEKELSLRASDDSSWVVAPESLRLLRSAEDAAVDEVGGALGVEASEAAAPGAEADEAEAEVKEGAGWSRARVKERALDGELGFDLLLRSTGIDETGQQMLAGPCVTGVSRPDRRTGRENVETR